MVASPPRNWVAIGRGARIRLVVEVLSAYAELLPVLRRNDARDMAARARARRVKPLARVQETDRHRTALRLGRIVHRVLSVLPTDKRCLIESLVLVRMLAQREIDTSIVIGVRSDEAFEAHAWVEHDGHPVLPPGDFERLLEL